MTLEVPKVSYGAYFSVKSFHQFTKMPCQRKNNHLSIFDDKSRQKVLRGFNVYLSDSTKTYGTKVNAV